jgi:hypothetical protein
MKKTARTGNKNMDTGQGQEQRGKILEKAIMK